MWQKLSFAEKIEKSFVLEYEKAIYPQREGYPLSFLY